MRMDPVDIKAFPDCANLPQHIRAPATRRVLDAFFESCRADALNGVDPGHIDRIAHAALVWGVPPRVDVHAGELRVPVRGIITPACGFTNTFAAPVFIIITHIWFDAF